MSGLWLLEEDLTEEAPAWNEADVEEADEVEEESLEENHDFDAIEEWDTWKRVR